MANPIVLAQTPSGKPQGNPQVGDLLTVTLQGGKVSGARLERVASGSYFVKLAGLSVPRPYRIGDRLTLNRDRIADWG